MRSDVMWGCTLGLSTKIGSACKGILGFSKKLLTELNNIMYKGAK